MINTQGQNSVHHRKADQFWCEIVDSLWDETVDPLLDQNVDPFLDGNVDPVFDPIVDPVLDGIVDRFLARVGRLPAPIRRPKLRGEKKSDFFKHPLFSARFQ